MSKSYIDYQIPIYSWIPCASGNDAHADVLVERIGDLFRLHGYPQMDFTPDDARRLGHILIDDARNDNADAVAKRALFNSSSGDDLVDAVCAQFVARSKIGQKKYGSKMTRDDLSLLDWLRHRQEEAMDELLYTAAAIKKLEAMEDDGK